MVKTKCESVWDGLNIDKNGTKILNHWCLRLLTYYFKEKNLNIWYKQFCNAFSVLGMVIRRPIYETHYWQPKKKVHVLEKCISSHPCSTAWRHVKGAYDGLLRWGKPQMHGRNSRTEGCILQILKKKDLYEYSNCDGLTKNSQGLLFPKTVTYTLKMCLQQARSEWGLYSGFLHKWSLRNSHGLVWNSGFSALKRRQKVYLSCKYNEKLH